MADRELSAFNHSCEALAIVTKDSRIKLWEVETSTILHELTSTDHLSFQYTCISWFSSESKRNKKSLLALGTNNGTIIIWDTLSGTEKSRYEAHKSGVTDVKFDISGKKLFSCGLDKYVCCWNAKSGDLITRFKADKVSVHRLATSESLILSASSSIKLWDIETLEKRKKLSGHSSTVLDAAFSPNQEYCLSCGNERFVNVWSCESDSKTAICVLSTESLSMAIKVYPHEQGFIVLILCIDNTIRLWHLTDDLLQKDHSHPLASHGIVSLDTEDSLIDAKIVGDKIIIAAGTRIRPTFHRLNLFGSDENLISRASIQADGRLIDLVSRNETEQTHSRLRADAQVLSLSQSQFPQPQRVGKRQREENHIVMSDESKGRAKQLAERISVAQDEQDEKEEQPNKHPKSEAPNTGSLHALLIQALKSDSSLLESCLAVRDVVTIDKTIQRLSSVEVLPLLEKLMQRLESRPTRGTQLIPWIHSIIHHHLSYLMTLPDVVNRLGPLYQIMDSRVRVFKKLLRLSGRLDMLLSHADLLQGRSEAHHQPKNIYIEDEEGDDRDDYEGSEEEVEEEKLDVDDEEEDVGSENDNESEDIED